MVRVCRKLFWTSFVIRSGSRKWKRMPGALRFSMPRRGLWISWKKRLLSMLRGREELFPSLKRRGGATGSGLARRGGRFGETFCRNDHPVCAFGASTPPYQGGEKLFRPNNV